MKILITGGAGFLGRRLAHMLLKRGSVRTPDGALRSFSRLILLDAVAAPPIADARIETITGDIGDRAVLESLIDTDTTAIFHLAAIVSGMAEAEFDTGMRINLDATRSLLEICRARGHCPRLVFTSSVAVYGGVLPPIVADRTAVTPQTSYGTQKAIGELLINDYSRRGFVDGRALRLPTVSVRPGRPNAAASSFASGIIREPLNGEEAICPVDDDTLVLLISPRTVIDCLITGMELPATAFGPSRIVNLPGLSLTVGQMIAALNRVAGPEVVARIRRQRDERIARMMSGWPGASDNTRAKEMGFPADENFDDVIRDFIEEELRT
jgi:nucleoside-diphosphate-sugar epimerase